MYLLFAIPRHCVRLTSWLPLAECTYTFAEYKPSVYEEGWTREGGTETELSICDTVKEQIASIQTWLNSASYLRTATHDLVDSVTEEELDHDVRSITTPRAAPVCPTFPKHSTCHPCAGCTQRVSNLF